MQQKNAGGFGPSLAAAGQAALCRLLDSRRTLCYTDLAQQEAAHARQEARAGGIKPLFSLYKAYRPGVRPHAAGAGQGPGGPQKLGSAFGMQRCQEGVCSPAKGADAFLLLFAAFPPIKKER